MKWVIIRDYIDTNARGVGNTSLQLPIKFRLYDDDGQLYYEGRASEADFEPLDWAMHYAGCTIMKLWNPETKTWEVL